MSIVGPTNVGRRIDQVQTRRRRMKMARTMKILYHYTGQLSSQDSMSFRSDKKLKSIDFLVDLQISIHKIVKNIVLTEDGKVFNIESMPLP